MMSRSSAPLKLITIRSILILSFVLLSRGGLFCQGSVNTLKFDSIEEVNGAVTKTSKGYFKGDRARIEIKKSGSEEEAVMFVSAGKVYLYFPAKNIAILVAGVSNLDDLTPTPGSYKRYPGLRLVGQGEVEGKNCDIYESSADGQLRRMWVDKEIDFPIKVESNAGVSYNRNIERNINLDDSLFELPSGARILEQGTGQAQ